MRFVICGAGAIGGVIGGQLAKAGFAVIYIEKNPAHMAAIKRHGLQLKGVHGKHTLHIPVVSHATEVGLRDSDIIFLAVKSFQSAAAAAELRQATDSELAIFCAQNGVGNEAAVAGYFQHVHGVMVLTAAKHVQPGEVVQTGNGPVGIGTYPRGVSQVARDVAAALDATDLPVYTTENIMAAKWNKLLLNLNNATMGLTGLASEEGYAHPEVRQWMADVWEEGLHVLQVAGIAIEGPPDMGSVAERIQELRSADRLPRIPSDDELKGRASLWQDLYHRRGAVEADALNGEIVRLGCQYNMPTPYNTLLLQLTNAMAAARELPGKYTITQLRERLMALA